MSWSLSSPCSLGSFAGLRRRRRPRRRGPERPEPVERHVYVTESARAHSYYSSKQVEKTCFFWLLTVWLLTVPSTLYIVSKVSYTLHIVSKSVLDTLYSVKKCLVDSLSVLFEVRSSPGHPCARVHTRYAGSRHGAHRRFRRGGAPGWTYTKEDIRPQ